MLFWVLGYISAQARIGHVVSAAQSEGRPGGGGMLSAETEAYIGSPVADKACGACLAAAGKFIEDEKLAALRERTKDMSYLPAGSYQVGSPEGSGEPDEHPKRQIRLDAFYMEKHEVTIADYMKFAAVAGENYPEWAKPAGKFNIDTGNEPYYGRLSALLKNCSNCPVIGVTQKDAEAYCASKKRRLPTEAEWEAAARGGAASAFSFGEDMGQAGDYAWIETNSGGEPHPVGMKKPNKYGLYDMHGNVWEMVADYYDAQAYSNGGGGDPQGPAGRENVIRGGSWAFEAAAMRSANRASTYKANDDIGFRCAVSAISVQ
ncbi:MAG: SUMF1/EgtB/PvdO family nonheme iron enzyme [Elusimicrobiales bacterium]|nr:SUMF1/EgtB/PvdO family nonheme iron enzyme [Elusimicrobiales bacterium]